MPELAAHVIGWIEGQGIAVPPGSRLRRMQAMFVRPDGTPIPFITPGEQDFEVALEAARDMQMLGFVFDQLASASLTSDFAKKLKLLLKDTALPQDGLTDSKGRDVQCELFVAAICVKAGMSPTFAEPDVHCTLEAMTFGIAVKRIKSPDTFKDRIRKAVEQIDRANLPGVIVADISVMCNPTNKRVLRPMTNDMYHAAARAAMHDFVDYYRPQLLDWSKGANARGLILVDHHVRQHPISGWGLDTMTFGENLSPHNQRRSREFDTFMEWYARGLATPAIGRLSCAGGTIGALRRG